MIVRSFALALVLPILAASGTAFSQQFPLPRPGTEIIYADPNKTNEFSRAFVERIEGEHAVVWTRGWKGKMEDGGPRLAGLKTLMVMEQEFSGPPTDRTCRSTMPAAARFQETKIVTKLSWEVRCSYDHWSE